MDDLIKQHARRRAHHRPSAASTAICSAPKRSHCVVMAYDFTVLAGTQGHLNHRKKDRMFQIARDFACRWCFSPKAEAGGRAIPTAISARGTVLTISPRLSGLVPLVGIVSGRCFAGNASLLGCCDVVIATANSNIGMGGPAMIESGGLGVFRPEEVGPIERADAEVASSISRSRTKPKPSRVAKKYLSYFQGAVDDWECADQRLLREIIPENRLRVYDIRDGDRDARRYRLGAGAAPRISATR